MQRAYSTYTDIIVYQRRYYTINLYKMLQKILERCQINWKETISVIRKAEVWRLKTG